MPSSRRVLIARLYGALDTCDIKREAATQAYGALKQGLTKQSGADKR